MCDATHNKSFGSGLAPINEVRKRIYYILDYIFVFFCPYLSDLRIESSAGWEIWHDKDIFQDMEMFQNT